MLSNWLARVGSAIPRGFSRHYILGLLEEEPMTGKEIIDRAILQSGGKWKPSPGLIYQNFNLLFGIICKVKCLINKGGNWNSLFTDYFDPFPGQQI